ncbi:MAG TPA: heavy metal-associated domain-containing protein [Actinomycetaceae bacterium]|nr:heavy metal-associated domain-containing protein [Actinomycetaceae bacterium]
MSNDPSPVDRTTVLEVTGMTCGHCVSAVTEELETIKEVSKVSVILREGGTSEVTVVSDIPLEESALRAAVDEAGYELTAVRVDD